MVTVIICGTPGTGKSTVIDKLKADISLKKVDFIDLSKFAIENDCTSSYDEELCSHVIDEDKVNQILRPNLENADRVNVIESIHSDIIEPSLVDLVFVCRADNTMLYDRLKARGYNETKITNNVQAEIFQTILDEAIEAYAQESIIIELRNDSLVDLDKNVAVVKSKLKELIQTR